MPATPPSLAGPDPPRPSSSADPAPTSALDLQPDFVREVGGRLAGGKLRYRKTVRKGLDSTLDAFFAMVRGENVGKTIVKL